MGRTKVHKAGDLFALHDDVGTEILPVEYGGTNGTIAELTAYWKEEVVKEADNKYDEIQKKVNQTEADLEKEEIRAEVGEIKTLEMEEELRVVANNLKSLEVSEAKSNAREKADKQEVKHLS